MTDSISLIYQPDGQKILESDLDELLRLSNRSEPIWGWLNAVDFVTGRFSRKLSHRVVCAEIVDKVMLITVDPSPTDAGTQLRRLHDECQALALNPYLRGETDEQDRWLWDKAKLVAWDVHLLPERDSELDRIMRAIQRGRPGG